MKDYREQRESTSTYSTVIFKEYHSTWLKEQKKNSVATAINLLALLKACVL